MPMAGGCLCGAVRYEADGEPLNVIHCHCSMCRKHSGAAFLTYALFDAESIRFMGDAPATYRSSAIAQRMHCGTCGSPLTFVYDAEPQKIYVTAGSFDDASALKPTEHWHVESRLGWIHLADGLPQFNGLPDV